MLSRWILSSTERWIAQLQLEQQILSPLSVCSRLSDTSKQTFAMAELQAPPPATAPEQTQSPAEQTPAENGDGEVKTEEGAKQAEEEEDPNRIPDNACETLYLHNLNEKVRIPGTLFMVDHRMLPKLMTHWDGSDEGNFV